MRNLLEYPVSKDEIIKTLTTLASQIADEGRVGDMRELLLLQAAQYVAYANPQVNELGLVFLDYTTEVPKWDP